MTEQLVLPSGSIVEVDFEECFKEMRRRAAMGPGGKLTLMAGVELMHTYLSINRNTLEDDYNEIHARWMEYYNARHIEEALIRE